MPPSDDEYEELRTLLATMRAKRDNIPANATGLAGYWHGLDWCIDQLEEWLGQRTYRVDKEGK